MTAQGLKIPVDTLGANLPPLPYSNTGSKEDTQTKLGDYESKYVKASEDEARSIRQAADLRRKQAEEREPLQVQRKALETEQSAKPEISLEPIPKRKETKISPEQTKEAFTTFLAFAMIGGALTRQPMLAAMNNMTAAMKGWQVGDTARAKSEMEQFDRNLKTAVAKRTAQIEERKAAYEKYKGNLTSLLQAEKDIALKYEDNIAAAMADKQSFSELAKHYQTLINNSEKTLKEANISDRFAQTIEEKRLEAERKAQLKSEEMELKRGQLDLKAQQIDNQHENYSAQHSDRMKKLEADIEKSKQQLELNKGKNADLVKHWNDVLAEQTAYHKEKQREFDAREAEYVRSHKAIEAERRLSDAERKRHNLAEEAIGMRKASEAKGGQGKGQSSNAQRFTDSMMVSANEISMMMDNVQNLPVSASTGFMGTSKKVNSIVDIPVRALGLSMTGEDARKYDAVTNGMGKALANLMTQGRVSSDKLMSVMAENKIQEGDSFSVAMIKTANIRQEVEAALEVMSHSPAASEDSINLIGKMRDRLHKSIPYTVKDVLKAESLADANPDMKFVDAVKQSGVKSAKPADDDAQKAQQAFGSYEPNKYTYGINPATGKFARKPKE